MRILTTILFILFSVLANGQDTIYFTTYNNGEDFSIKVDTVNDYPRQDAIRFQETNFDSINSLYFQDINLVSEKALTPSDSVWLPTMALNIGDTITYEDIKYIVIQKHYTTIGWQPTNTLSVLFVRMKTDNNWYAGIVYLVNDTVLFNTNNYYCIQSHTSQTTWNPELTKGVLWTLISSGCAAWYQTTYSLGDCVTFNGVEYTSLINGNNFSPSAYPQGWFTSVCLPYVASTYNLGECIIFNGSSYTSKINNNSWTPLTYPAGWQLNP